LAWKISPRGCHVEGGRKNLGLFDDAVDGRKKSGINSPVEVGTSSFFPIIYRVLAPSQVVVWDF